MWNISIASCLSKESPNVRYAFGIFLVALAAILFGVAGAFAKVLFVSTVSPIQLTALRAITSAIIMLAVVSIISPSALRINTRQLSFLFAFALIWAMVTFTFYMSVSLINVAVALTLEYLAPVVILIIGVISGTHKANLHLGRTIALCIAGCILVTGAYAPALMVESWSGVAWGLMSALAFALYTMLGNRGHDYDLSSTTMTTYALFLSMLIWVLPAPWLGLGDIDYTAGPVGYIAFISIGATVIPFWLYVAGLKYINPFSATVVGMLDPVVAGLAAFALLDEVLAPLQVFGIGIVFYVIATLKRREEALLKP